MRRLLLIAFGAVTFYHLIALAWGWPNPFWLMPLNTLLQWGFALAHALPTLGCVPKSSENLSGQADFLPGPVPFCFSSHSGAPEG
jgi:hypothetical protein